MVLPIAAAVARRRVGMVAKQQMQQRRGMAHAPAPEWTGIDKVVRGYFPQDHQLALAILGGYTGIFVLVKIKGALSGKKVEEPAAVVSSIIPAVATTGIPSVDSPEFDKYLDTDAFYKMLDSDEQLAKVVEDMK
jgi:hypothetical protein